MCLTWRRLYSWLNLLLVLTLWGNLLWPLSRVSAAPVDPKTAIHQAQVQSLPRPDNTLAAGKTANKTDTLAVPLQQGQVVTYTWDFESGPEGWEAIDYSGYGLPFWEKTPAYGPGNGVWRAPAFKTDPNNPISDSLSYIYIKYPHRVSLDRVSVDFYVHTSGLGAGWARLYVYTSTNQIDWQLAKSSGEWGNGYRTGSLDVTVDDRYMMLLLRVKRWLGWGAYGYLDNLTFSHCQGCPNPLPPDQSLAPNECPFCGNADRQNYVGGPINTHSGNYGYQAADFNIPTVGPPLRFERSYNSYTIANSPVYTRPLGYGWTHNYDLDLTFAPGEAQLKAPHGSRMRFIDNGDGTYNPYFGVWAKMVSSGSGATAIYTITAANQETFVFNHLGQWTGHQDPKGNATTLTRTGGVTLTRVTGPTGQRWLDFGYDTQGRLSNVTDNTGRQVSYNYDAEDNLIGVNDTRGNDWSYSYAPGHLLQEVRDPENKIIERTLYDGQGQVVRQENGTGDTVVQIEYFFDGRRVITEAGRLMTDTYDTTTNLLLKQSDALGRNRNYTMDNNFNRTQATDPRGNSTGYNKDQFGLTHAITDALNNPTAYSYDAQNNLTAATDAHGTTISYSYDSQNNLTQITTPAGPIAYTYNPAGQVTSITNRRSHTWSYQYDAAGNLIQITNPKSEIQNLQYDALGRLTTLTNARNMTTRFDYDNADNLTFVTANEQPGPCDPTECNLVTEYRYDKANRLTAIIDPQGRETRREYDAAGRLSRVVANYQNGSYSDSAPDEDIITRYQYDQYGRLQSVFETLNQSKERETRYEYDALNRIQQVTLNYENGVYDPNQPDLDLITAYNYEDSGSRLIVTVTNPAGIVTRAEYDELGRPAKIINNYQTGSCPANECNLITTYNYDSVSNLTSLVDPLNIRTDYEYDTLNRLTDVIENYTGSGVYGGIPDENIKTSFQYDPEGNLTQLAILSSPISTLQYDQLNRVRQQANALGHTWQYQYDPAGNLSQITDPTSQIQNLQYNLINRLTTIDYPAPDTDVTFTYDKTGNRIQMTDSSGTTAYSYDNLNRPTQIVNPKSEIVNYQYDARSNRTQLTYPDGKSITYSYDRLDQLTTLNPDWDSGSYQYSYNNQQQLEELTRPNGLTTQYGYDTANRLTGLTHQSTGWTMEYGYTLDETGNLTRAEETFTAFQHTYLPIIFKNAAPLPIIIAAALTPTTRIIDYQYDNLYRLIAADYSTGEFFHYTYDPRGNRLTQSAISGTTNYTYDNANRLTQVDGQSYSWDDNGNLLDDGQRTYSYDSTNRLISVTKGITTTQFGYNGDGDRISQTVGSTTTDYVLDSIGLAQVLAETTGGQSTFYVPGLAQYNGSSWQYFAPDRLGSVRQIADPTGQLLLAQSFDPFGNVLEQSGAGSSRFGYTGEQVDPSGLVYLRARYYQPTTGSFITPDTIIPDPARSIGWNGYAYSYNNPVRYTDPSGKNPLCLALVAIDGPFPAGDVACAVLIAYTLYAGFTIGQNVDIPSTSLPPFSPAPTLEPLPPYELGQCPDPAYHPGPTLGGEFTGPLHLPGPTLDIPLPDTTLDFPLLQPGELPNILEARNIGGGRVTFAEALAAGDKWLGAGYKEIAPGVFRSADGQRQFRITSSDLTDPKQGAHAHFESIGPDGRTIIENAHIEITDP